MAGTQKEILNDELAKFVRRYEAILRLIRQIDNGQFVSARQVAVWLGPKANHKLALLKKQERESLYQKPALICEYEVHLQRADTLHKAAQIFVKRGKLFKNYPKKLQAHREEATRLYQVALDFLKNFYTVNQKDALKWFDRPVNFKRGIRPEFTEVPRVITNGEFKKNNGFASAGLERPKSTRGNYIHLKRELLQREIDVIKPIYQGLEKALIDISSLVKPNFANPNLTLFKSKPSKKIDHLRIKIEGDSQSEVV
jgi:hypothetical protein